MDPFPANINDITTVKQLIESGTPGNRLDINKQYDHGITLLHYAATHGNICIVKYLVESGANVDIAGQFGYTPLQCAIIASMSPEHDNIGVIRYLLDQGASKDYVNDYGENAVDMASLEYHNSELAQFIESYEPVPTKGVHLAD